MQNNILYLSLTGMTEALGKSQVISYLKPLSKKNKIYLISFERTIKKFKKDDLHSLLSSEGIIWVPLKYSNRFGIFSTLRQIFSCFIIGLYIVLRHKINIVHARSMIPALMGYLICSLSRAKLLFDIRDFSTDEKVDRGRIKHNSLIYNILLKLENHLYKKSDHIVVLTHISKDILINKFGLTSSNITVVPTCADSDVFYPISKEEKYKIRTELNFLDDDFICIHVGTVTGWYLFDQELIFFKELKKHRDNAKFLILNQGQHDYIKTKLIEFKIDQNDIVLLEVEFEDVNKYINISNVALYFIIPSYSKKAAAPTKYAEFVRVNLPSITNAGVGDMEQYINKYKTGVIVDPYNINTYIVASTLATLDALNTNKNFKDLYEGSFSIKVAVNKYQNIYDELSNE